MTAVTALAAAVDGESIDATRPASGVDMEDDDEAAEEEAEDDDDDEAPGAVRGEAVDGDGLRGANDSVD